MGRCVVLIILIGTPRRRQRSRKTAYAPANCMAQWLAGRRPRIGLGRLVRLGWPPGPRRVRVPGGRSLYSAPAALHHYRDPRPAMAQSLHRSLSEADLLVT